MPAKLMHTSFAIQHDVLFVLLATPRHNINWYKVPHRKQGFQLDVHSPRWACGLLTWRSVKAD